MGPMNMTFGYDMYTTTPRMCLCQFAYVLESVSSRFVRTERYGKDKIKRFFKKRSILEPLAVAAGNFSWWGTQEKPEALPNSWGMTILGHVGFSCLQKVLITTCLH